MLRSVNSILGAKVIVTDGDAGKVRDLLFDDEKWVLRYLIVDCGGILVRDEVLVSPIAIKELGAEGAIEVNLSYEQLENSPHISTAFPISRRHELEYHRYYNWPSYWSYSSLWATGPYGQSGLPPASPKDLPEDSPMKAEESHLRSVREVAGYRIHGKDRTFGHVEDFIMDDGTWAIRYLVVDTRNWLPSKAVLIATQWVDDIRWASREVHVPFTREAIRSSPAYEPEDLNSDEFRHDGNQEIVNDDNDNEEKSA